MLQPDKKAQLDQIVLDMGRQNAPKQDVQMIVNDFLSKYDKGGSSNVTKTLAKDQNWIQKGVSNVKENWEAGGKNILEPSVGVAKGILKTLRTGSSYGEKQIKEAGRILTPKSWEKPLGFEETAQTSAEKLIPKEWTEGKGGWQKSGMFLEKMGEFALPLAASSKLTAGVSLFRRAVTEGLISGGVATAQGQTGGERALTTGVGFAFPYFAKGAGAVINKLFGKKALAKAATGLPSSINSQADDVVTTPIRVRGKTAPAYESFDDFLVKEGFFKDGLKTTKIGMLKHAEELFGVVSKDKRELLNTMTGKVPVKNFPQIKPLLEKLIKYYDDPLLKTQQNFLKRTLKGIKSGQIKSLGADLMDDIRVLGDTSLPKGAFKGAEPAKVKAIEEAIAPFRRYLSQMDVTGQLQHDNVVKRTLALMLGFGKTNNPMAMAADKGGAMTIFKDIGIGAGTGLSLGIGVPGAQAVAAPLVVGGVAKAIADQPPVAAFLINQMTKVAGNETAKQIVKQLPLWIEGAMQEGKSNLLSR